MTRPAHNEFRHVGFFLMVGFCLVAVTLLTPNATTETSNNSFFSVARKSTWQQLFDWPAAWCSVKIILLSLGLGLMLDAFGSALASIRLKSLALTVFYFHIITGVGLALGLYYLLKALL